MDCLKVYFIKTSYHIETNQTIRKANQFTGFCMKWVCTERYFRIDYIHSRTIFTSLRTFFWVVRRALSGNLDVVNFYFASLNSKQRVSLKTIFQFKAYCYVRDFILWNNVSTSCYGFKYFGQIRLGQKFSIFCSDHFRSHKYSFNNQPVLKHFIMFSLRTALMCFHKFLQIHHVNDLNSY